MTHIFEKFATREAVLAVPPAILAERLLLDLSGENLHRGNFLLQVNRRYGNDEAVERAYAHSWAILAHGCFLFEKQQQGWFVLSQYAEAEKERIRQRGIVARPRREGAGRWIVERPLSSEGQGPTSLARDKQSPSEDWFVIKELKSDGDEQARRRFEVETKAL